MGGPWGWGWVQCAHSLDDKFSENVCDYDDEEDMDDDDRECDDDDEE